MVKSKLFLLNMLSLCGATLFKKDSYPKASLIEDTALSLQPLRSTIQCAAYFMALLNKGNHPSLEYYIFEEVTNLCSLGTIDKLLAPPGAPPEQAVMGEQLLMSDYDC